MQKSKLTEKLLDWREDLQFIKKSDEYYTEKRRSLLDGGRVVVWFSCGATSAIAAKLALLKYQDKRPVHVVYCDTGGEHRSNKKFLRDVERWIEHPVEILRNRRYKDHFDVFRKERYLVGPEGAKCTTILKKEQRHRYQDAMTDIQIFGFGLEEISRAARFRKNNFEIYLETPLIDRGLDKGDCLAILQEEGIELPFMYHPQKSGSPYPNNNCIGCVKAGAWYWNKIRIDFPRVFKRMVAMEAELGRTCVTYKKKRIFLKDLPPDAGLAREEANQECSILCADVLGEFEKEQEK